MKGIVSEHIPEEWVLNLTTDSVNWPEVERWRRICKEELEAAQSEQGLKMDPVYGGSIMCGVFQRLKMLGRT